VWTPAPCYGHQSTTVPMAADAHPVEDLICLTVDVEWAHPEVLADLTRAFDERGLRATLFCTHPNIPAGNHERALHPNFLKHGDTMRLLSRQHTDSEAWSESHVYDFVVRHTKTFCPEAIGVRSHSLFYDNHLAPTYRSHDLRYDSSVFFPFMPNIAPVRTRCGMLELPIFYMDHIDIVDRMTDFRLASLRLGQPGLKIFDFHPNIVFINAQSNDDYLASKPYYHDVERLTEMRRPGRGVRTVFLELLDYVAGRQRQALPLREVCEMIA